ncbi:MAG TPA: condensation domain-containing protein, partial [Candidatus Saccharimonadales bacterium]|nr:condensation domain-containing protein [Candidatus Saccharimonadales bacterium]
MTDTKGPTGAARLSAAKRALLERMLAGKGAGGRPPCAIPKRGDPASAPLSFAQQRLWFVHQIDPSSPAYNVPAALRVRGPLDIGVLDRCLQEVARRHESLRTRIDESGGSPVQVVEEASRVRLEQEDLSADPDREERARGIVEAEALKPFDLSLGP